MPKIGLNVLSKEEYEAQGNSDFSTYPEEEYILRYDGYKWFQPTVANQYNPEMKGSFMLFFTPTAIVDDEEAEIVDVDGQTPKEGSTIVFFFDPLKMGLSPVPAKSRQFLNAVLYQRLGEKMTEEQREQFPDAEALLEGTKGREVIGNVEVKKGRNNIVSFRSAKKKSARSRTAAPSVVAAAKEAFGDDVKDVIGAPDEEY